MLVGVRLRGIDWVETIWSTAGDEVVAAVALRSSGAQPERSTVVNYLIRSSELGQCDL